MTESTKRELRFAFGDRKYEETEDGGLLVRDVRLLAAGTWTDSLSLSATEYTPSALENAEWKDNGLWSRHAGGRSRSIVEKIGEIRAPYYENEAVYGDLYFHRKTQLSRDIAEMTKAGLYNYVSSEVDTADTWDPVKRRYVTDNITFTGVATVNRGACTTCTIKDNEAVDMAEEKGEAKNELGEELSKRIKELEEGMNKRVEDVKAELSKSDYSDRIKELQEKLEGAEKRIKELEDNPVVPQTTATAERELEEPKFRVRVDRKKGEVYGV